MATPIASTASVTTPPQFPAGPNPGPYGEKVTLADIGPDVERLASAPSRLRDAVSGLTPAQLDTKYKNWTVRQITHHLGDSHANIYIRWKLALTEDVPTIKPYNETAWSELAPSKTGDIASALTLFDGVHQCWLGLIRSMTIEDLQRQFFHPEQNKRVRLADTVRLYAWHVDHHVGQILWMRTAHGW